VWTAPILPLEAGLVPRPWPQRVPLAGLVEKPPFGTKVFAPPFDLPRYGMVVARGGQFVTS